MALMIMVKLLNYPQTLWQLDGIVWGESSSYTGQLKNLLSNANIFGINLYEAGIGDKIEEMFVEEISGKGAIRETLKKYL